MIRLFGALFKGFACWSIGLTIMKPIIGFTNVGKCSPYWLQNYSWEKLSVVFGYILKGIMKLIGLHRGLWNLTKIKHGIPSIPITSILRKFIENSPVTFFVERWLDTRGAICIGNEGKKHIGKNADSHTIIICPFGQEVPHPTSLLLY